MYKFTQHETIYQPYNIYQPYKITKGAVDDEVEEEPEEPEEPPEGEPGEPPEGDSNGNGGGSDGQNGQQEEQADEQEQTEPEQGQVVEPEAAVESEPEQVNEEPPAVEPEQESVEPEPEPAAEEEEPDMINPSVTITLGEDEPTIGVAIPITIVATDNIAITNITCTIAGKKKRAQMSTGKGTPIATSTYTFTPEEAGDYTVIATATDKSGNTIEASEIITVSKGDDTETINFNAGLE